MTIVSLIHSNLLLFIDDLVTHLWLIVWEYLLLLWYLLVIQKLLCLNWWLHVLLSLLLGWHWEFWWEFTSFNNVFKFIIGKVLRVYLRHVYVAIVCLRIWFLRHFALFVQSQFRERILDRLLLLYIITSYCWSFKC